MVDQGHPVGGQLLVQLPEQHGASVPLLGPPQGVVEPGLEVNDVSDSLFAVHLCKIVLGFVEVLNGGLHGWWEVEKMPYVFTATLHIQFSKLIIYFYWFNMYQTILYSTLWEEKKTLKFFKTSSVLISSLAPSSTGKMTTHVPNLCAERARGGAFMPHDTLTYNSEHSESKYWPRFNAFSSCGFYIFVFCRSIT